MTVIRPSCWLAVAALLGIAGISVTACDRPNPPTSPRSDRSPSRGGDVIVSVRTEPASFSPYLKRDGTTYLLSLLTDARLVRLNPQTEDIEPWLADSWTRSEDGLTYVLKLRPNVQFSDGAPFTADDVVFSMTAVYDRASVLADSMQVLGKNLQATALDPTTVKLTFPGRFGPGLRLLDELPILPKHKLQDALSRGMLGQSWTVATPVSERVGLGPFAIAEYRPGERIVLTRNNHYFRFDGRGTRLPYLDRVIVEVVPEQDAQILKLQSGDTDAEASEIRPEDYAPMKQAAEAGTLQLLDLGVANDPDSLWINLRQGAFDGDPRRPWLQRDELRQAISHAIDRQAFADTVFLGAALPVFGPITPSNKKWYSAEVPHSTFDRQLAKQLLARIGLEDRNADGLAEDPHGTPARLTLLTAKGQTALERGAIVIRDQLKAVGLTIDVVALEGNALIQKFVNGRGYDAVYFHLASTSTDPALNRDFWLSTGDAHIWNPAQKSPATAWEAKIDTLMADTITAADEQVRKAAFLEVQKIFAAHEPMLYFAAPRVFVAASTRMTNLTPVISRPQLLWAADTIAVTH